MIFSIYLQQWLNCFSRCILVLIVGLFNGELYAQELEANTTVLRVEQITKNNATELIKQGPNAIGGIDDWFISNGTLCAVVSDITHENQFSTKGGALVDLGFCDRADDRFSSNQDFLDGKQNQPLTTNRIEIEKTDVSVSIITYGKQGSSLLTTRYSLNLDQPTQLAISKKVSVSPNEEANFNLYSSLIFNYHALKPFVLSTQDANRNVGFEQVDFVTRGISAISEAAHNADMLVLVSAAQTDDPIAYGWQLKSAQRGTEDASQRYEVPRYILADEESVAMIVASDTFYLGDGSNMGLLQLAQVPLLSLDSNESLYINEVIYVARKADISSITDQLPNGKSDKSWLTAQVDEPDSAVHIVDENGKPISFVRPDKDGKIGLHIEKGKYKLRYIASADRVLEKEFDVQQAKVDLGELKLPAVGTLLLPQGQPMRLVFVGLDGTLNPDFGSDLTGFSVSDETGVHLDKKVSQLFLAGIESDPKQVLIAPGSYEVYATHGPEYSIDSKTIQVSADQKIQLEFAPFEHSVPTPGYIAADLHVHSEFSFDNSFNHQTRVRTFVAEQGEVMVSSEHDVPTDFAPVIKAMGVDDQITSIAAVEMTGLVQTDLLPYTGGHVNFFPFEPKLNEYRNGMFNHESIRLRDALHIARTQQADTVAQLNHARQNLSLSSTTPKNYKELIDKAAYLDHMGVAGQPYNPELPINTAPNNTLIDPDPVTGLRDIDVDAMEIINPGGVFHDQRIEALRKDWLSFIRQGYIMTATANSDSHDANTQVAVPRNMVAVSGDTIATFKQAELLAAIKSGNSYGTTGPMIELSLSKPNGINNSNTYMGQLFSGSTGQLNVKIRSADWIPISTLKIQINGEQVQQLDASEQREFVIDLNFDKDAFVTIEVTGSATPPYSYLYPDLSPYAFSNPIYIDADGDGQWQAPFAVSELE